MRVVAISKLLSLFMLAALFGCSLHRERFGDQCLEEFGGDARWDPGSNRCEGASVATAINALCADRFGAKARWNPDDGRCVGSEVINARDQECRWQLGPLALWESGFSRELSPMMTRRSVYLPWGPCEAEALPMTEDCASRFGAQAYWNEGQRRCEGSAVERAHEEDCRWRFGSRASWSATENTCIGDQVVREVNKICSRLYGEGYRWWSGKDIWGAWKVLVQRCVGPDGRVKAFELPGSPEGCAHYVTVLAWDGSPYCVCKIQR
jgi:hypothetical protein